MHVLLTDLWEIRNQGDAFHATPYRFVAREI